MEQTVAEIKILSEKQKEVLMQVRKSGNAYGLADIIKKTKEDGDDCFSFLRRCFKLGLLDTSHTLAIVQA